MTWIAALNGISTPPVPQSASVATEATKPIAANTRWPVKSMSIMPENMRTAMSS
jgi:hypothetical protein